MMTMSCFEVEAMGDEHGGFHIGDVVAHLPKVAPAAEPVFAGDWHVFVVHERTEHVVARSAGLAGLEAWYPQRRYWARLGVRRRAISIASPLFPGYVFARAAAGRSFRADRRAMCQVAVRRIGETMEFVSTGIPMVIGGLRSGEAWVTVNESVIERLRAGEASGRYDETRTTAAGNPKGFRAGEKVEIRDNPFEGFPAVIVDVFSDAGRASVEVMILGRATIVHVSLDELSRPA
jgi:transcription antitermination factor NusG